MERPQHLGNWLDYARLQYSGPLGGDGGERHGRDLASAGDSGRPRRVARGRQCGRCRDRGGRDAVRRRAGEHRDRRRLLHPLFAAGRAAGGAQRFRAARLPRPRSIGMSNAASARSAMQTPHAVTMPGAVDAWCTFNREYGTRPLAELLEPAARAAEEGYVVTPRVAADWSRAQEKLRDPVTAALFLPGGKTAQGRRQDAEPAARRHLAPDRPRGPRRLLRRRGHARHRRPTEIAWRAA